MRIGVLNGPHRRPSTHHKEEGHKSQTSYAAAEPDHLSVCLSESQIRNDRGVKEEHTISIIVRFLNIV